MRKSALLAALATMVAVISAASATGMSGTLSPRVAVPPLTLVAYFHGPNASAATSGVVETNFHVKLVARLGPHRNFGGVIRIYGRKVKPGESVKVVATCAAATCSATVNSQVAAHWKFQAKVSFATLRARFSNVVSVVWYQKPPVSLELTVNGKSDRATTALPTNDDPTPLIVHYGASLNIKALADKPMPAGWTVQVYHPGDPLDPPGAYYLVCKTTTASCGATRPAPTNAASADFDDGVYAQIVTPNGVFRSVQILVYYRK